MCATWKVDMIVDTGHGEKICSHAVRCTTGLKSCGGHAFLFLEISTRLKCRVKIDGLGLGVGGSTPWSSGRSPLGKCQNGPGGSVLDNLLLNNSLTHRLVISIVYIFREKYQNSTLPGKIWPSLEKKFNFYPAQMHHLCSLLAKVAWTIEMKIPVSRLTGVVYDRPRWTPRHTR